MVNTTARFLALASRKNGSSLIARTASCNLRASSLILGGQGNSTLDSFIRRWNSNYPAHEVVGMPSLSPVRYHQTFKLFVTCNPPMNFDPNSILYLPFVNNFLIMSTNHKCIFGIQIILIITISLSKIFNSLIDNGSWINCILEFRGGTIIQCW